MEVSDPTSMAALVALEFSSYLTRVGTAVAAFFAAISIDKVIARVLGLACRY